MHIRFHVDISKDCDHLHFVQLQVSALINQYCKNKLLWLGLGDGMIQGKKK